MAKKIFLLAALILATMTVNVHAEENPAPFETLAMTYVKGGPEEFLALIKMKSDNSLFLLVSEKDLPTVGLVSWSPEVYDFYLHPNEYNEHIPLICTMMFPDEERGQIDDELGEWRETLHLIPIYAMFNVTDRQVICSEQFFSATDMESTHFHSLIQDPTHIRLIEILMTHMPRLHELVQAQGIELPTK